MGQILRVAEGKRKLFGIIVEEHIETGVKRKNLTDLKRRRAIEIEIAYRLAAGHEIVANILVVLRFKLAIGSGRPGVHASRFLNPLIPRALYFGFHTTFHCLFIRLLFKPILLLGFDFFGFSNLYFLNF